MTRLRTTSSLAAFAAAAALIVAGCNSDDPGPGPSPTKTSAKPTASPPPADAPKLNADEKTAYGAAVAQFDLFQDFVYRAGGAPDTPNEVFGPELATYTVQPATDAFSDELQRLRVNDARTEGRLGIAWTSPVKVTEKEVRFKRCETPGDWVLVGKTDRVKQTENSVSDVTMVYLDETWLVKNNSDGGEC